MQITDLIASKSAVKISEGAGQKLRDAFERAQKDEAFGNGRYVRNVLEKARMKQAERVLKIPYEEVTEEDLETILAEDIEICGTDTESSVSIGFSG